MKIQIILSTFRTANTEKNIWILTLNINLKKLFDSKLTIMSDLLKWAARYPCESKYFLNQMNLTVDYYFLLSRNLQSCKFLWHSFLLKTRFLRKKLLNNAKIFSALWHNKSLNFVILMVAFLYWETKKCVWFNW